MLRLTILFVGFVAVWWLMVQVAGIVINAWRAARGVNVNDPLSAFIIGLATGPLAVLGALSPFTNNPFRGSLAFGGFTGTIVAVWLFRAIFVQ